MNKIITYKYLLFLLTYGTTFAQLKYPITKKITTKKLYHNIEVTDDYGWLSNKNSKDVNNWVKEQNKVTNKYFRKLKNYKYSKYKLEQYLKYDMHYEDAKLDKNSNNDKEKVFFKLMYPSRNAPLKLYYSKGSKSYTPLINPNSISTRDQIILSGFSSSSDNRFLAYHYSRNGSDWKEVKILRFKNRKYYKETLKDMITPNINWYGQGFFYEKYNFNSDKKTRDFSQIMYHNLDTEQSQDQTIFKVDSKDETLDLYGTKNQSLYIIKKSNKKFDRFSYYYFNPKNKDREFLPLFENISYDMDIVKFKNDTVSIVSSIKHKRYLIQFPIDKPKKWKLLTPSYKNAVGTSYEFAGNKIVTSYQTEKSSFITVSNLTGKVLGEISTPEGLSIDNLLYNNSTNEFTFTLSSYTVPPVLCKLDLDNFSFEYLSKTEVSYDASKYKFIKDKFISYDGKKVPIFIVFKDSISKNGDTPILLNTYGGYGIIAAPKYNPGIVYFLEKGGAFAYVNVRGGGELGHLWREDGRKLKKKNGFLDLISAAKYLKEKGLSKPKRIGVMGTSHGGLLAAAAITKRPELFGAAVINMGALDMINIENTETGATYTNINEFGSTENKAEFENLYSYSPFHNIEKQVNYPSTLIITADNDTRVPPHQSYKFAGKLQNGNNQTNPILLWTQKKAGHYGANEYNRVIEEYIFKYNFLYEELQK